ncbi:class I SAM-dependent methyltransferase [Streptacidiphilus cavernicola]|uniref:Trans-aconitate 2-methyltransferase n=1 Tax=Streptacidiphilus cavernicola TaxID=3342716 RepID=A0ABV6VNF6_9ACTN
MTHTAHDHCANHAHQPGHGPDHQPGDGHGHDHSPGHDHSHDHEADAAGQAEILDLDAEVLAEHIASITAQLPVESAPRHIVDLGCGTGAGTFALLARFPEAEVTAVDSSTAHLRRLRDKAAADGLAGRVRTVEADLDAGWPDLGAPDLVWASASMHHMADPDRTLRRVHDLLAPGGLFAVVELAGFPRFLPDDAPAERPGLEERCHAASNRYHAEHVPHRGADWGPKLTAAGFTVESERTITVDIKGSSSEGGSEGSRSEAIGRYALNSLQRMRGTAAETLPPEDLAALDRLLDTDSPDSILRRDDLVVRTERTVWAARRPHTSGVSK